MNNFFSPARLTKYFMYDLKNAWKNGGVSLILCILMPATFLILGNFISLSADLHFCGYEEWMQAWGFIGGIAAAVSAIPVKLYGQLTKKVSGSDYLMLPASTLEKYVSMIMILCVVLPVLLIGGLYLTDTICSLFANTPFFFSIWDGITKASYMFYICLIGLILSFAFGGILFKKAKIPAVIGILIVLLNIFSIILATVLTAKFGSLESTSYLDWDPITDRDNLVNVIETIVLTCFGLALLVLNGGIYLRLKKMQK